MTEAEKRKIATTFIEGLRRQDANLLSGIMTPNVIWSIPGSAIVSGEARGVKGIIEGATHFAGFSLKIDILYVVVGFSGVALLLHNTGTHNGKILDEHLTTVIQFDGAKIKRLDTFRPTEMSLVWRRRTIDHSSRTEWGVPKRDSRSLS